MLHLPVRQLSEQSTPAAIAETTERKELCLIVIHHRPYGGSGGRVSVVVDAYAAG